METLPTPSRPWKPVCTMRITTIMVYPLVEIYCGKKHLSECRARLKSVIARSSVLIFAQRNKDTWNIMLSIDEYDFHYNSMVLFEAHSFVTMM